MKKLFLWLVVLLMSASLQLCTEEGEILAPVKVQFTCVLTSPGNAGGRVQDMDIPASLLISLENNAGVPVITLKEVKLLRVGDNLMSEPLELIQGFYKITDFLLVAEMNQVMYATPKRGSSLAKAVINPLPYGIYVNKNRVSNVEMEVIDVTQQVPEDFGYASFHINAVNPLKVSVFTSQENVYNLTSAKARIWSGDELLRTYSLGSTVNLISFPGDAHATYMLEIEKEGYNTYRKEFVYSELMESLDNLPLKIYLVESLFTMLAYVDEDGHPIRNYYQVSINGEPGSLSVDWGDGTSTVYSIDPYETIVSHAYPAPGNFLITVTGDLDKIRSFKLAYFGRRRMDAFNMQGLTQLEEFKLIWTHGPKVVDLTHNINLHTVDLNYAFALEQVILPVENKIRFMDISGPNQLSETAIDDIVNRVYESAVLHHETGGSFVTGPPVNPGTELPFFELPISAGALEKLYALRDDYQWYIRTE